MSKHQLEIARRDLLDLSARNRLINTPRSSSRSSRLEIVDELSDQVFERLVHKEKSFSFLSNDKLEESPDPSDSASSGFEEIDYDSFSVAQPDEILEDGEIPHRHTDDKLQTTLKPESLQKKLLKQFYDARTFEEEQGVNTLYLALGFLKWFEDDKSKIGRQSPLILIPVQLERQSVGERFRLSWDLGEIATNLSLQAKLNHSFGIELPDIPDDESFLPSEYFAKVAKAVDLKKDWEIVPNAMVLWFFSFAKFLMYKDLESEQWPEGKAISEHDLLGSLVGSGFSEDPPICGEEDNIDDVLQPLEMVHVLPADSSQTVAIEEAKRGRNLVIQGPPGTGKSQTITNIIASSVEAGKKVLFVSEKMAALQVVKERLSSLSLGDLCLELHSNKSNKKAVLHEIEKTLMLGKPKADGVELNAHDLRAARDKLNRHAKDIHRPIADSTRTPYQVLGELVRLKAEGMEAMSVSLENPEIWTHQRFQDSLATLKDLGTHLEKVGDPSVHCWRGVAVASVLPSDADRIYKQVGEARKELVDLIDASNQITSAFGLPDADSLENIVAVANHTRLAGKIPNGTDRRCLAEPIWERLKVTKELVSNGIRLKTDMQQLDGVVSDVIWDTDLGPVRRNIKAYGRSWFRRFNSKFREAISTFSGVLQGEPPTKNEESLEILDRVIACQQAKKTIGESEALGRSAFGDQWQGKASDWEALQAIVDWRELAAQRKLPQQFLNKLVDVEKEDLANPIQQIKSLLKPASKKVKDIFKSLSFDLQTGLGSSSTNKTSLSALIDRFEQWQSHSESLSHWIGFTTRVNMLPQRGMADVAKRVMKGELSSESLVHQFELAYFESLMRLAYSNNPHLSSFSGISHETVREEFKKLDSDRYRLARDQVAAVHYESLPRSAGDVGEVGVLKREIKKKRRHMPIRKLLASAGNAVQAIKPIFMMSPISVAQFLEPGGLEFDILLIDEASQVKPVDAFGAIARSKQIVVVGDERQLPPTNFFDNVVSDNDDDVDPDIVDATDIESILGLCSAQSMNERMLTWHYRSRHHSLISVSNHEFYDNRLFVVPSPSEISSSLGLSFVHVKDGVFDRGKSATNRVEAQVVADAVIEHARAFPHKTLGIGAFSVAQRDAILNELEIRRRQHSDVSEFFAPGKNEPFFVKNLENIQGDERDVIFISVGYGVDANGKDSMNFGPIGKTGGERRLNVLITRAKERCVVFSSITSSYIDLKRTKD